MTTTLISHLRSELLPSRLMLFTITKPTDPRTSTTPSFVSSTEQPSQSGSTTKPSMIYGLRPLRLTLAKSWTTRFPNQSVQLASGQSTNAIARGKIVRSEKAAVQTSHAHMLAAHHPLTPNSRPLSARNKGLTGTTLAKSMDGRFPSK